MGGEFDANLDFMLRFALFPRGLHNRARESRFLKYAKVKRIRPQQNQNIF